MLQLSGLDTGFLNMETPTTFGHVSQLMHFERAGFGERQPYDAIRAHLETRLHLLAPLRRRLVTVPFGLDHPYWIEDGDFDLDFHVRHVGVPPPGDERQLAEIIARIIGRALDRSRPLWELYIIEGLADGTVALLLKLHHAMIDGQSSMQLFSTLLDDHPAGREINAPAAGIEEAEPPPWELMARAYLSFLRHPARAARMQLRSMQAVRQFLTGSRTNTGPGMLESLLAQWSATESEPGARLPSMSAPRTPFNRAITAHRRVAFTPVALAELKQIKQAAGTTLNDVVMAVCAGALRRYLVRHEALPALPLIAMVPVSVRTGDEAEPYSNRVSSIFAELATDEPDPAKRLARIHAAMQNAKEIHNAIPASILQDFSQFAPPALAAQAARAAARLKLADYLSPPCNVVISNVPGPRHALFLAGAELQALIPVSTVGDGMGLNMTVVSYRDRIDFGLVACRELVPDLWDLIDDLKVAIDELRTSVSAQAR